MRRAKVNERRGRQPQQTHPILPQHLPDSGAAGVQLLSERAIRLFAVELLQGRTACQRIEEITIEGQPRAVIHKSRKLCGRIHQRIQIHQQIRAEQHRASVNIHLALRVDRPSARQRLHRLFMQELANVTLFIHLEHAMVLARFHVFFEGNRRRAGCGRINLQRIE